MPECWCRTKCCKLTKTKTNYALLNFSPAFRHPWCLSISISIVHIHVHAVCSSTCWTICLSTNSMSMSMLPVRVHGAFPWPCCISMSVVHVHVHAACQCQCPCCMSMSMSKLLVHVHVCLCVYKCWNGGLSSTQSVLYWTEKKLTMQGLIRYLTKPIQSDIFVVWYRTEIMDATASVSFLDANAQLCVLYILLQTLPFPLPCIFGLWHQRL